MRPETQRNALIVAALVVLTSALVGVLLPMATGRGQPGPAQFAGLPTSSPTVESTSTPVVETAAATSGPAAVTPSATPMPSSEDTGSAAQQSPVASQAGAAAAQLTPPTPIPLRTERPDASETEDGGPLQATPGQSVARFATDTPAPVRTSTPTSTAVPTEPALTSTPTEIPEAPTSALQPAETPSPASAAVPPPTVTPLPPGDVVLSAPALLRPLPSQGAQGATWFEWEPLPLLPDDVAYEVVWWNLDEDPSAARGFAPPTVDNRLSINLDVLDQTNQFTNQTIYWTVLPVRVDPYERLVQPGATSYRAFIYGSSGAGDSPPPPPR